jgi:hypothetical protein
VTGVGLLAALSAARMPREVLRVAAIFVVVAATASIVSMTVVGSDATTAGWLVLTIFAFCVPWAVLAALRDSHTVDVQTVFGAIAVYLVIGIVFALVMTLAARFSGTPYFAQGSDGTMSQRIYFSYVTLATLGYGDLTPATGPGRLISILESIIGNLYLVTAVSLVVSRIGTSRRRPQGGG